MITNYEERRTDKRVAHKTSNLKIVFTSDSPRLFLGKVLEGTTVDISASGLQIILDNEIPVDSIIDVRVTLYNDFKEYYLSGKVRWCNKSEHDDTHHVGIALHNLQNTETDLDSWQAKLKS